MALTCLVKKDNKILLNAEYMEAYIPKKMFKKGLNEILGDKLSIMGLFNFRFSNDENTISKQPMHTFTFPSMMLSKPSSIKEQELELFEGSGVQKYIVAKYYRDEEIMCTTSVVADIDNVEKFINLLIEGNLPNTIPYSKILELFIKNMEINKQNLGVSAVVLSVVISEIYRYKKDQSVPFRKMYGKGNVGELDYISANSREVCANNSTFSALTFEDIDTMLVTSINKSRYKRKENESPVEQIIRV